jgi:hypothetical protein
MCADMFIHRMPGHSEVVQISFAASAVSLRCTALHHGHQQCYTGHQPGCGGLPHPALMYQTPQCWATR